MGDTCYSRGTSKGEEESSIFGQMEHGQCGWGTAQQGASDSTAVSINGQSRVDLPKMQVFIPVEVGKVF